ncbi:MFS general substrate transporter [Gloeophyllum trabeum ATCC 11539]|uniref:MFS general substrate transporter n=1 Tax=Gloeophyllum trabeum (strain ATCC 11539 / FP-39264 / Madison 617) TaxID=670483 RepID=S7QLW4_GLOTA|nr:MFS general substrate transporter [Gloeophyllum trabeum ATCC 11539]EPQ60546.1 MFS general substrate transporter [Gloeophyllum trabeum ATCC 11539]
MSEKSCKNDHELGVHADPVPDGQDAIYRPEVDTSGVDQKKLMRRIDMHVVPWLGVLYLLNFLDRGSIGNAKLYNLEKDIGITDRQYLIALTVFFFPYSLLEPPSNVALKKLRPSRWLSFLMLGWGIVMTLHGVMHDYADLLTLRFFLGFFEAGLYPGIVFYISCWYKRSELGSRVAVFFSSATVAGAFSGLLAAGIQNMHGVGGKPGWAWIFILEGLFTVLCAVASFWIIQDFPDTAKFLSEPERVWVVRRLQEDQQFSAGGEKFQLRYVWDSLKDVKTWLAMGIYAGFDGPLFAFSLFTPTIINQLGYTATIANLLSVPVYAWACLVTVVVGFWGDRIGHRGVLNLVLFGTGLVSYVILIASRNPSLSYFAVYLGASAIYPTIPNSVAWVSSNTEGSYKRSVTLGMAIGFGNLNGAVSSNVYRAVDKPWYSLGHGIILAYLAIGWLSSLALLIYVRRENARKAAGARDEVIEGVDNKLAHPRNGTFASVDEARRERGDRWSGFRYTL